MSLRSTADGDRDSVTPSTPMAGLLSAHLATVRMDLWSSTEQLMALIKQRAEAFQEESSRQLEADLEELRMENRSLRDQMTRSHIDPIESRTGGTGDTMPPHAPQTAVARERNQRYDAHGADVMNGLPIHVQESPPPVDSGAAPPVVEPPGLTEEPDAMGNTGTAKELRFASNTEVNTLGHKAHDSQIDAPRVTALSLVGTSSMNMASYSQRVWGDHNPHRSPRPAGPSPTSAASGEPSKKHLAPVGKQDTPEGRLSQTNLGRLHPRRWSIRKSEYQKDLGASRSKIFGTKMKKQHKDEDLGDEETTECQADRKKMAFENKKEGVFADASAMKERVRAAVARPEYNVADYYWDEGWCQAIARHQFFEYITLSVIAFNALWIAIDVDLNDKELLLEAHPVFQIVEHGFCLFFTFEWTVRFLSFREKRNAARDAWFCFDSALVIIMIFETWIMTLVFLMFGLSQSGGVGNTSVLKLIRLVRLTRMARMAKLLRAVPELIILIKGIAVAARSVFFTLVLLFLIIYVFAIVLRQVTDDSEIGDRFYASVPEAMNSLLLDGVLPDQSMFLRANGEAHVAVGCFLGIFILLSSLTVMNMLVGVLCEVVSVVSSVEKEQLTVNYVKQRLANMFVDANVDQDGSKSISKLEFESMLTNKEAAEIIQDMGVDVIGLVDFADIIFEDDIELSFADFMELVLQLRGSNNCTVKDMVDLRKFVVTELSTVQSNTIEVICHIMNFDARKLHDIFGFIPTGYNAVEVTNMEADLHHQSSAASLPRQRFQKTVRAASRHSQPAPAGTHLPGSVSSAGLND